MNKTEAAYAAMLEAQKKAGRIQDWKYESVTFKIAPDTRYTPDFMVVTDSEVQFHEVKGGLIRDDAVLKYKLTAEIFPQFKWEMWQLKNQKTGWVKIREL